MKRIIHLLFVLLFANTLFSQQTTTLDVEVIEKCFVDSIDENTQVEIIGLYWAHNGKTSYKTFDFQNDYVVQGTIIPCKESFELGKIRACIAQFQDDLEIEPLSGICKTYIVDGVETSLFHADNDSIYSVFSFTDCKEISHSIVKCDSLGNEYLIMFHQYGIDTTAVGKGAQTSGTFPAVCYDELAFKGLAAGGSVGGVDLDGVSGGGILFPSGYLSWTIAEQIEWTSSLYGFTQYDYDPLRYVGTSPSQVCFLASENPPAQMYWSTADGAFLAFSDTGDNANIEFTASISIPEDLFDCDTSTIEIEQVSTECVESQEWTYGIDNTGTSYDWTSATYEITVSDGSTITWTQSMAANGGWSAQLTEWATNIEISAQNAGLQWFVEPRAVNNVVPTDISGGYGASLAATGLNGAPTETIAVELISGGMVARYVNIQICAGQPVPVSAKVIDHSDSNIYSGVYDNNGRAEYALTTAGAILGEVEKFYVCRSCGIEPIWYLEDGVTLASAGQIPNCGLPCGTLALVASPPDRDCTFEIDVACDNNNSTVLANFTNTVTRRATICNGEQIAVDYFVSDPNDASALIDYQLTGSYVDCGTGEEIALPIPDCEEFEITTLYKLDNVVDGLIRTEWDTPNTPATAAQWGDDDLASAVIDNFDYSTTTPTLLPNVIAGNLGMNETNSSGSIQDIEIKEGYIVVDAPILIRWTANSEGALRLELGTCCGELEEIFTYAKGVGVIPSQTALIPAGIHQIKLTNLDFGATNSSWTAQTSSDGITWVNNNTPTEISRYSTTKPNEVCEQVKVCEVSGVSIGYMSGLVIDISDYSDCSVACESGTGGSSNNSFTTICKDACVGGVSIAVTVGYDSDGNVIWYKDTEGNDVTNPDFDASCAPITCATETEKVCSDGDYTNPTIIDGEEVILVLQVCSDGSRDITGALLLSDLTTSIALPTGFISKACPTGGIDPILIGCVVDDNGVQWNNILINGEDLAYQNIGTGQFGTPTGTTKDCDADRKPIAPFDEKWCAVVNGDTLNVHKILFDDGTCGVKEINGNVIYEDGEFQLISCCEVPREETLYYSGFTAQRPLPNTGWNNQLIQNSSGLDGDFEMCFTIESETLNTPQMIGFNSDPNTNASYLSIDCALYFWNVNGSYRIWNRENGVSQGLLSTLDWTGKEVCMERVGGVMTYKLAGTTIGTCPIGTGTVYLDDSHYSVNSGTWVDGSITYSDFVLVEYLGEEKIRCQAECDFENDRDCFPENYYVIDTSGIINGVNVEYWGANAAVNADITTIFTTDFYTHINGVADGTGIESDWDLGNFTIAPTTGQTKAAPDQFIAWSYIHVTEDMILRDNNNNTGEFAAMWLNEGCGTEEQMVLNNDGDVTPVAGGAGGLFGQANNTLNSAYPISEGVYWVGFQLSDATVNGGIDLEFSTDGGTTYTNFPASNTYTTEPKQNLVKGWTCTDNSRWEIIDITPIALSDLISCEEFECETGSGSGSGSGGEVTGTVEIECANVSPTHRDYIRTAAGAFALTSNAWEVTVFNDSQAEIRVTIGGNTAVLDTRRTTYTFSNDPCREPSLGSLITITNLNGGTISAARDIIINTKEY